MVRKTAAALVISILFVISVYAQQLFVTDEIGVLTVTQFKEMDESSQQLFKDNDVIIASFALNGEISFKENVDNFLSQNKEANSYILFQYTPKDNKYNVEINGRIKTYLSEDVLLTIIDDYFTPYANAGDYGAAIYNTHLEIINVSREVLPANNPYNNAYIAIFFIFIISYGAKRLSGKKLKNTQAPVFNRPFKYKK